MQNLGILRTWDIFRIEWISRIQFTQNFLWPCHLRTRGIFRALSNIYNGAFCSEPCVTLAYLEPLHVQNLRNIWNPVKHLWCCISLRTSYNPGIFRTLVYTKPEEYSVPCQASIWCSVSLMKPDIFTTLIYSEHWHILKPWYIQNPGKYIRWSILFWTLKYSIFRLLIHSKP